MKKQIYYLFLSDSLSVKLHLLSGIIIIGILAATISLCRADYGTEKAPATQDDLSALSIEDLMEIEVTSVSRKAERLSDASAAVFVITQDDIRRSGVTSIPGALRMVPGLEVARIDSNKWAITARGFNGRFAYEIGYRAKLHPRFSLDIAAFYNIYHHLNSISSTGAGSIENSPVSHIDQVLVIGNAINAETYGAEVASDWSVLAWWRLYAAYTLLEVNS